MTTHATLRAHSAHLTDGELVRCIRETDRQIADTSTDLETGRALRAVRASLYDHLESRHPHVSPALEAWAESLDDARTYTEVLFAALGPEVTG